jgi:hypothetical protein
MSKKTRYVLVAVAAVLTLGACGHDSTSATSATLGPHAVSDWFNGRFRDDWRHFTDSVPQYDHLDARDATACHDAIGAADDMRLDLPSPDPGMNLLLQPLFEEAKATATRCVSLITDKAPLLRGGDWTEYLNSPNSNLHALRKLSAQLTETLKVDGGLPL